MTTLRWVVSRLALVLRCAGIVYTAAQVAIWHSYYTADFRRLAGPALAVAWAAVVVFYLRKAWPTPRFACLDSAVYVVLALSAQAGAPPAIRAAAYGWLIIVVSGQVMVPAWFAPGAFCLPLALASPLAYAVGATLIAGTGGRATRALVALLCIMVGVHVYGRAALYRRAAAADAVLEEADRDAAEQYVVLARNIERREHERLVHDTVLNTLTALARAGPDDAAQVVTRCQQDVALIEEALSGRADADAPDLPGPDLLGPDLLGRVRAVAAEMRARGLLVHLEADGGAAPVPAQVATAIANATREALSNVAVHAGTGEAWVEVKQGPAGLRVAVRDRGTGFDPARVDRARLGLRRSIAERAADCGGHASIWSAPGQGTVVSLSWPAGSLPC